MILALEFCSLENNEEKFLENSQKIRAILFVDYDKMY